MNRLPDTPFTAARALRRRSLLALPLAGVALLSVGCAAPAQAAGRWVDLQVVDRETGRVLPITPYRGRRYLAAPAGARYALRVSNRSGERLLAVLSVDGVNIVTGQTASVQQSGYVLEPWQSAELTGWRKSEREVAAFEFTNLPESYAARTGRPDEVGVIGLAVFRERPQPVPQPWPGLSEAEPSRRREERRSAAAESGAAPPAPAAPAAKAARAAGESATMADAQSANAAQPRERLGTGHGEREASYTSHTQFERASRTPAEVLAIQYDRVENLVAMGVLPAPQFAESRPARPFPLSRGDGGFVPDPPLR